MDACRAIDRMRCKVARVPASPEGMDVRKPRITPTVGTRRGSVKLRDLELASLTPFDDFDRCFRFL
jgi:hypothetical protein